MSFTARDLGRVIASTAEIYAYGFDVSNTSSVTSDALDVLGNVISARASGLAFTDLDASFPAVTTYQGADEKNFESCIPTDSAGFVADGSVACLHSLDAGGSVLSVWDVAGAALYWRERDAASEQAQTAPLYFNGWLYWAEFSWADGTPPTFSIDLKRGRANLSSVSTLGSSSVDAGDWPGGASAISNDSAVSGNSKIWLASASVLIEAKIETDAGDLFYFWLFDLTGSLLSRVEDPDPGSSGYAELPWIGIPVVGKTTSFGPEPSTDHLYEIDLTDPTSKSAYFPETSGWALSTKTHASVGAAGTVMGMWARNDKDFIANTIATPHGSEPEVAFSVSGSYDLVGLA